ncbi:MAG: biotin/lipoyl-containing protein, partial [Alphaproteobacteria bacterium]
PYRNFLPSIGRLTRYRPPAGEGVRVDAGVFEGSEITVHYDPMIAKLVAHGPDRDGAADRLGAALDAFEIEGVGHNVDFVAAVAGHPRFRAGRLTTGFIAEEFPGGFRGRAPGPEEWPALAAVAVFARQRTAERDAAISGQLPGRRHRPANDWVVRCGDEEAPAQATAAGDGMAVRIGDRTLAVESAWAPGMRVWRGTVDGAPVVLRIAATVDGFRLRRAGADLRITVLPQRVAALARLMPVKTAPDVSRFLLSPMPGLLASVAVSEGQEVKAGEALAVVEAMKMENVLRAERDGRIGKIHAAAGSSLAVDQKILEFE